MIQTKRLILRRWNPQDRGPFARMNADARVMRYFPAMLSRAESDALAESIEEHFRERGFGLYAAELKEGGAFIGYIGLAVPGFQAHFTPCVEIGWRLAAERWNQGMATEGARAAVEYGFSALGLKEIVAFTAVENAASRRVMEKLGMRHDPGENFEHPGLAAGHRLRAHVLYRIGTAPNPAFMGRATAGEPKQKAYVSSKRTVD